MDLVNRADSALLVIDAQEDFYRFDPSVVDLEVFDRFLDTAAWVTAVAAAMAVPIVATEEDSATLGGTADRIAKWFPSETAVLEKEVFGAAEVPSIMEAIRRLDRGTLVLIGLETDVCVSHTALGLRGLGFRVVAVVDALYTTGDGHEHGIRRLQAAGVELLSARQLWYEWCKDLATFREFDALIPDPPGFSK